MSTLKYVLFTLALLALALFLTSCGPVAEYHTVPVVGPQGIQGEPGAQGAEGDPGATGVAGPAGSPATTPVMINLCPSSCKPRYGLCISGVLHAAYAAKGGLFAPLAVGKHTIGSGINKCTFIVAEGCVLK